MSLTSKLKTTGSDLRSWFEERFPNLRPLQADVRNAADGHDPILPADTAGYPWSDVGTAFDHRTGLMFDGPQLHLAERAASVLTGEADRLHSGSAADQVVDAFTGFFEAHRRRCDDAGLPHARPQPQHERDLARDSYTIALLETIVRTGIVDRSPLARDLPAITTDQLTSFAPEPAVDDLAALANVAEATLRPAANVRGPVHVGPTFAGSATLGGADADLIAGTTLIETKTMAKPVLRRPAFYQLIGYALIDFDDTFKLTELAVFLARQQTIVTWPVEEVLTRASNGSYTDLSTARQDLLNHLETRPG